MEKITFCIPSKNNRRYLEACIPSIRKNSYRDDHDIIVFVDADNDGTVEWLKSVEIKYNLKYIVNETGDLFGIGKAYDKYICKDWLGGAIGDAWDNTVGKWFSDERLKENIQFQHVDNIGMPVYTYNYTY